MKKGLLFFALVVFSMPLMAQEIESKGIRVSSKVSQYLFGNFPISIEKSINDCLTFGFDLAYKPGYKQSGEIKPLYATSDNYFLQNFWNTHYNSYTLGLHSKCFLTKKNTLYMEPNFYYRHWWFNEKQVFFGDVEGYNFNATRSERQNVFGTNLLIGRAFNLFKRGGVNYVVDLDMGPGFVYRTYDFVTEDGILNGQYVDHHHERGENWHVTINFGLSFGLEF